MAPANIPCSECGRSFATQTGLKAHKKAKHQQHILSSGSTLSPEAFDAPVDEPGRWVERQDFHGRKSFGVFSCPSCTKVWMSAHAFRDFTQVRWERHTVHGSTLAM